MAQNSPEDPNLAIGRKQIRELMIAKEYDRALNAGQQLSNKFGCPEYFESLDAAVSIKRGQYEHAMECYDRYLRLKKNASVEATRDAMIAKVAVQSFTSLLDDHNDKFDTLYLRLKSRNKLGVLIAELNAEQKAFPNDQKIAALLAHLSLQDGADRAYTRALAVIDPGSDEYKWLEASYLIRTDDNKSAIPLLFHMRHKRKTAMVCASLATALASRKRLEEAVRCNAEAKTLKPTLPLIILNEGIINYQRGNYEEALKQLNSYLQTTDSDSVALARKVETLLQLNREKEAGDILVSSKLAKRQSGSYYSILGTFYDTVDKPKQALGAFDKSIELEPKNALFLFRRASLEYDLWLFQEAAADCHQSLQYDPKLPVALELLDKVNQELERADKSAHGIGVLTQMTDIAVDSSLKTHSAKKR